MKTRKRSSMSKPSDQQAQQLCDAIHSLGDYEHVRVRAEARPTEHLPRRIRACRPFFSSRWRRVQSQFPQAHWTLGTYALRRRHIRPRPRPRRYTRPVSPKMGLYRQEKRVRALVTRGRRAMLKCPFEGGSHAIRFSGFFLSRDAGLVRARDRAAGRGHGRSRRRCRYPGHGLDRAPDRDGRRTRHAPERRECLRRRGDDCFDAQRRRADDVGDGRLWDDSRLRCGAGRGALSRRERQDPCRCRCRRLSGADAELYGESAERQGSLDARRRERVGSDVHAVWQACVGGGAAAGHPPRRGGVRHRRARRSFHCARVSGVSRAR